MRKALFDGVAAEYDADPHHALVAQHLVAGLAIPESVEVGVDVGCGTGAAAFAMLARLAPERILAIDVSPGMLRVARRTAKQLDPDGRITWRLDEAIPLPVEDSSVDLAVCSSSLHFLGAAALPDWSRALRGGGQLAFSLPERTGFAPPAAFAAVVARDLEAATPDEASALARKAGFVDVQAHLLESHRDDRSRRTILVWA